MNTDHAMIGGAGSLSATGFLGGLWAGVTSPDFLSRVAGLMIAGTSLLGAIGTAGAAVYIPIKKMRFQAEQAALDRQHTIDVEMASRRDELDDLKARMREDHHEIERLRQDLVDSEQAKARWFAQLADLKPGDPIPPPPHFARKLKVLLVEDHCTLADPMARILRGLGFDVFKAGTSAEAIDLLKRWPDVIFADIMLPSGSGLDLVRHVLEKGYPIPIVMMTGLPESSEEVAQAKALGVSVFIKPVDVAVMLHAANLMPEAHA